MVSEAEDDFFSGKLFRGLLIGIMFSSAGTGITTLTRTDDRFRGEDFRREISTRDAVILDLKRDLEKLTEEHHDHEEHSAKYTQIIVQISEEIEELKEEAHEH